MHPFVPFITEELWRVTGEQGPKRERMLIQESWPDYSAIARDAAAEAEMNWVKTLISEVRSVRAEMNVPPSAKLPLGVKTPSAVEREWLAQNMDVILRMARLEAVVIAGGFPKGAAQIVVGDVTAGLVLEGFIDFDKERARLTKDLKKADEEIARVDQKLNNENFVSRAPEDVVQELRDKRVEHEATRSKVAEALKRLG
jgi:valyl-tRNA synthetase